MTAPPRVSRSSARRTSSALRASRAACRAAATSAAARSARLRSASARARSRSRSAVAAARSRSAERRSSSTARSAAACASWPPAASHPARTRGAAAAGTRASRCCPAVRACARASVSSPRSRSSSTVSLSTRESAASRSARSSPASPRRAAAATASPASGSSFSRAAAAAISGSSAAVGQLAGTVLLPPGHDGRAERRRRLPARRSARRPPSLARLAGVNRASRRSGTGTSAAGIAPTAVAASSASRERTASGSLAQPDLPRRQRRPSPCSGAPDGAVVPGHRYRLSAFRPVHRRRGGHSPVERPRQRLSVTVASVRARAVPASSQLSFDELGTPLREVTFVVLDLETTGGSAQRRRDHRGRRGEGARRRAARRAGHAGRPGHRRAARHRRAHRHHHGDDRQARRGCRRCCPSVLEFLRGAVLVAHNAPFDAGFLRAACERHGQVVAPPAGAVHGPAGPRRPAPRRGAERPAGRAGRAVRHGHAPHPPRARRRPRHRRGAAPAAGARRQPRRAEPRGAARAGQGVRPAPTDAAAAAQAGAGRGRAVGARGLPVPRPPRRGALRRHQRRPAAPGAQLLHLRRATPAGPRHGGARRARRHRRLRARAGGRGAGAAAHRRAPPPLQPPLAATEPHLVGRPDGRGVPAAVGGHHAPGRRARAVPSRRAAVAAVDTVLDVVPLRPCTQRIPATGASAAPCALHEMGRCAAPCAGLQTPEEYAPGVACAGAIWSTAATTPRCTPLAAEIDALAARERFETAARRRDRLAGADRRARAGRSGSPRWPRCRSSSVPARTGTAAGRSPSCGTGGWPPPASPGAVSPPMPVIDALRLGAQTVLPGAGPAARRAGRGGPAAAPLADHRRHPARARRAGVDRTRPRRRVLGRVGGAGPRLLEVDVD